MSLLAVVAWNTNSVMRNAAFDDVAIDQVIRVSVTIGSSGLSWRDWASLALDMGVFAWGEVLYNLLVQFDIILPLDHTFHLHLESECMTMT
jgi:hypothetical protein